MNFISCNTRRRPETLSGRQLEKALDCYNEALPLFRSVADQRGEALALCGIGWTYHYIGEKQKALDYCKRGLALFEAAGDRRGQAFALHRIGRLNRRIASGDGCKPKNIGQPLVLVLVR